jgi:hypothetical protein
MKRLRVEYTHEGRREEVEVEVPATEEPDEEQRAEAAHYVQTLSDNGQIAEGTGPMPPGATHKIDVGSDGKKRLVRKRFSAI